VIVEHDKLAKLLVGHGHFSASRPRSKTRRSCASCRRC
jgi:hypothetical protein